MNMEYQFAKGYHGYAVKFSPYYDNRLAVATAANFGLVGNGRLYVLGLDGNGIQAERMYNTPDALYDVAWAENCETQLLTACGDGSVKLFDTKSQGEDPVSEWNEHGREVYSVAYNLITKDTFVSSSWDGTIKIWSPNRPSSLLTIPIHSCTYSATFAPHAPAVVSAVSSDSHLRIFDLRTPASASNHLVQLIPIHGYPPQRGSTINGGALAPSYPPSECLTHDWNKYNESIIATAGVDQHIRIFDIRMPKPAPLAVLTGHQYAVRKLAWSPHHSDVLMSGSYDMTVRVWTDRSSMAVPLPPPTPQGPTYQIGRMDMHTEFVTGVDWCLFGAIGWVASTAWDERVIVWDVHGAATPGSRRLS